MTKHITYKGRTQSRRAWAKEVGISPQILGRRLKVGYTISEAINTQISGLYKKRGRK